jgi:hypothetical protein
MIRYNGYDAYTVLRTLRRQPPRAQDIIAADLASAISPDPRDILRGVRAATPRRSSALEGTS